MKRTVRFLTLALAAIMLSASIPFGAFAQSSTKRFIDVPEGSWYYDAVYYVKDNKLFAGTSKTHFSPNNAMTRAMLVTVLASMEEIDGTKYTVSSFSDVEKGKWYFCAVEWAFQNGIVGGVGDGKFAPEKAITRQEMVAMLKTYAKYKGYDTTYGENYSLDNFADADTVSSWALSAVKWAVKCGFISGIKGEYGSMLISPKTGATRAAVAVIMKNFCSFDFPVYVREGEAKLTVNGNDISEYTIVYSASNKAKEYNAAARLCEFIFRATGNNLPIVDDSEPETEYEILIGETNRESGEIDRAALCENSDISFTVKVSGNKLFFAGAKDRQSRYGTFYSVYYFAEKYLGFDFYQDSCIICKPEAEIALEDGFEYTDGPAFLSRETWSIGTWNSCLLNNGYYSILSAIHSQGLWIGSEYGPAQQMPCMTSESNIRIFIEKTIEYFNESPEADAIWLSINDSTSYCQCDNCMAAYREDGTRAATVIRLCNRVSEALENAGHKDKKLITIAYNYCTKAPKVTKPCKNIILYYCTNAACGSHDYSDTSCKMNSQIYEQITSWGNICSEMFIWDYVADFSYAMVPLPSFHSLRQNIKLFYDNHTTGIFINGHSKSTGEFERLRGYLYCQLMKNPNISEEEYFDLMNGFIRSYYGDEKLYLRQYLEIIEELTNDKHYNFNAPPGAFYDYEQVYERTPEIDALWEGAFAQTQGNSELYCRVEESYASWLYLRQCASYGKLYENGTEEQKSAYVSDNRKLLYLISKYGIIISQGDGEISAPENASPETWKNVG